MAIPAVHVLLQHIVQDRPIVARGQSTFKPAARGPRRDAKGHVPLKKGRDRYLGGA